MFKELIAKNTELGFFEGEIPVNYQYTLGIAGDRFFSTLKEKGDFIASKCPDCGRLFVPPSLFCEECFVEIKEYVSVGLEGELYSFTESHYDFQGKKLDKPQLMGLVKFKGCAGGIINKLNVMYAEARIGMRVKAVLKPAGKRTGSVDDIVGFEKA